MKKFRIKRQAPEGYLTLKQTAELLQVSEMTIRRYIKNYDLPATKPAGIYLIERHALNKWMKEHE